MAKIKDTLKRDISFDIVQIENNNIICEDGSLVEILKELLPEHYDHFTVKVSVSLDEIEDKAEYDT